MIKKGLIFILLLCCFSGNNLFSQDEAAKPLPPDTTAFEKRIKAIDESIIYLRKKDVEIKDITVLHEEVISLLKEIRTGQEIKDYNAVLKLFSYKLSVLEEKIKEKISLEKSINIIYTLMVVFGGLLIVIMVIFSIVLYSRRK